MLAVYGRMLTRPVVMYKGDKTASEYNSSEPQRSKFPTTSQFEKIGCLGVLGSGNNSGPNLYKSAIKEFRNNLDACGIQTSEPFSDQIILDKSRTMEEIIHEMTRKESSTLSLSSYQGRKPRSTIGSRTFVTGRKVFIPCASLNENS